jgi:hypothetical protein
MADPNRLHAARLVSVGFVAGAAVAFWVSLLRSRRITASSRYLAPEAARGPDAVTDLTSTIDVTQAASGRLAP